MDLLHDIVTCMDEMTQIISIFESKVVFLARFRDDKFSNDHNT